MSDPIFSIKNGEAAVLKRWHVYSALFMIFLATGTIVFQTGGKIEQVDNLQREINEGKEKYVRKDVLEERLKNIEKALVEARETSRALQEEQKKQSELLQRIILETRKRGG